VKFSSLDKYKEPQPAVPHSVWTNPLHFIAFGFGSGAMPFAPGTFGTLMAIPFYLLLAPLPLVWYVTIVAIIVVASIWLSEKVSKQIAIHDHPGMCIDEIVGYLVTMIAAPAGWVWILIGFLLFRFFDIVKPPPINLLDQHVGGGFGVIIDDVVAGLFSMVIIQILARMF
jgi:phosphatidylglycerophosphatase A